MASQRRDQRSEASAAYRKLYKTARWQRRRALQLTEHPLCERCLTADVVTAATVAHHKVKHNGDMELFWFGELESLCAPHHDRDAQLEDKGKKVITFGADGWPI